MPPVAASATRHGPVPGAPRRSLSTGALGILQRQRSAPAPSETSLAFAGSRLLGSPQLLPALAPSAARSPLASPQPPGSPANLGGGRGAGLERAGLLREHLAKKEISIECEPEAKWLDQIARQSDLELRKNVLRLLEDGGIQLRQLSGARRVVLRVLDDGSTPKGAREASRLFLALVAVVRSRLSAMTEEELLAASTLLAEAAARTTSLSGGASCGSASASSGGALAPSGASVVDGCADRGEEARRDEILRQAQRLSTLGLAAPTAAPCAVVAHEGASASGDTPGTRLGTFLAQLREVEERLEQRLARAEQQIRDILVEKEMDAMRLMASISQLHTWRGGEKVGAKAAMLRLPCPIVRVNLEPKNSQRAGKITLTPFPTEPEILAKTCQCVAGALRLFGVKSADVSVVGFHGVLVQIDVSLRGASASVTGAAETIARAFADEGDMESVRASTREYCDLINMAVAPLWPFARVQAEAESRFGCVLSTRTLEQLVEPISRSAALCRETWDKLWQEAVAASEETTRFRELEELLELKSQLPLDPCSLCQGATTAEQLLSDASRAQRQIKEHLAPGTPWSQTVFDEGVPADDASRSIEAPGGKQALPGARLWDLGVQSAVSLGEAVEALGRHDDASPWRYLVDASRLTATFATARELLAALVLVERGFDVVSLANGIQNPTCLGHRAVIVHVRLRVQTSDDEDSPERDHIVEIRLTLVELEEVKRSTEEAHLAEVYTVLQMSGELSKDACSHVRRLALTTLDLTWGRALRQAARQYAQEELAFEMPK